MTRPNRRTAERKPPDDPGDARTLRELSAILHDTDRFFDAVDALQSSGFDRSDISVLASQETVEQKLGDRYIRSEALVDHPDAPRQSYVSKETVGNAEGSLIGGLGYVGAIAAMGAIALSGGTLVAAAIAALAGGGAGGAVGAGLAGLVDRKYAKELEQQLRMGGLLLWVNLGDGQLEEKAKAVLEEHGATHVRVRDVPVERTAWADRSG